MTIDIDKRIKALGIGRFQVMALLQAVRYYLFYKDIVKAKSWGLNRAVFYAWAKYYGSKQPYRLLRVEEEIRKKILRGEKPSKCPEGFIEVLGECVKTSSRGYYVMGDVEQTPYDYDRQVNMKIKRLMDPEKVWEKTVEYISCFPEWVLKDPVKFYKYVYEPVRDTFFKKLVVEDRIKPPHEIIEKLESLEKMIEKSRRTQKSLLDYVSESSNK